MSPAVAEAPPVMDEVGAIVLDLIGRAGELFIRRTRHGYRVLVRHGRSYRAFERREPGLPLPSLLLSLLRDAQAWVVTHDVQVPLGDD